ncbi:peptidase M4 domain-containing protein [Gottschalkia acidurici 9a]|uniref:Peptidase M4 domain-containing protein n=1 Tax=Gottschalkia acidurici (strain ATCC 7906 / DSM 604 / BCRC 14475 / CIP 104303 / KCTC 5404 / NCIMB 10678 / 9a) TaxID=1128398 RepID=K0B081_GOTA9|nr:PepSY domain-containing protein [Gottschalkia acidurici]AFS79443.1 peptidase M4 domain-containing protein [Gottschalkia acidurici 9a]
MNQSYYWYNSWSDVWINNVIPIEMAIAIALEQVQGEVIKAELDRENGILVYEIHIRTPYGVYEVEIDATTGQVLDIDLD